MCSRLHIPKPAAHGVMVQIKADIGFINEKLPQRFRNRPVYVCFLAELSNGRKIHFARIRYATGQMMRNADADFLPPVHRN